MSYTLFQATLDLARILMDVYDGTATGGTTTTVADTALWQSAGWFSDDPRGTLWLHLTTKASKVITGHSGTTITFTPAQSGVVAAADKYSAAPGIYPKYLLIQAINAALVELGQMPYQKSVTPTAGKQSYISTDDAVFAEEIIGVELANAAATPYDYMPHYRWHQGYTGTTPTWTFFFDIGTEPQTTYPMNIYYKMLHPSVSADADIIHPAIHPNRLKWEAAVFALRWRYERTKQDDPSQIALLNEGKERVAALAAETLPQAQANAQTMRSAYPIDRKESPHHAKW